MKKNLMMRGLSILLAVVMLFTSSSITVLADSISATSQEDTEEEKATKTEVAAKSEVSAESDESVGGDIYLQEDLTEEDFTFTTLNGSFVTVTGYQGSDKTITIPSACGEYIVQEIAASAFAGTDIESVTIPNTVARINGSAFQNCTALTEVIFEGELEEISANAFAGCTALESFTFPNGLTTIRESAFAGCTSLKQLNFPTTLTTIYAYAFNGCTALTEVQLPDSVTTMGYRAFLNCMGLTKINYPVSFVNCPGKLGSYYSSEYGQIFYGCTALTKVTVPEGVTQIAPASFQNSAVSDVTLPSTLTGFGAEAFRGCKSLETIVIPESVTAIGSSVFADCTALSDINLPEGMESIGESAFAGCMSLASIRLPESMTTIYAYAFNGCTALSDIELNDGLTTIYAYAFQNCTAAESLAVPDSVTQIGYRAFLNMTGLTQANLPKGLTGCPGKLGSYYASEYGQLFYGCSNLKTVTIPEGIGAIPAGVFESCTGITSLVIPEGITAIGDNAFRNMSSLQQISLPKSLTSVSTEMLAGCSGVRKLVIPENVKTIYTDAFKGMTGLTEVELPEGLTTIYAYAFENCTGLKNLELPDSVTTIGYRAFLNMTSLRSINYPVSLESCPGKLGSYYNSEYGELFYGCSSLKNLVIPEGVSQIPAGAFRGCTGLYKVLLPESLVTINAEAFSGCTGLEIIAVGAGVTSIGANAFANCTKLTIYGSEGSYAQTYAAENNIPFTTEAVESESGVITGTVADEAGRGIEGAEVSIYRVDKQRVDGIVTTGTDGTFTFDKAVDTKTYRIWVTHPQYSFADSPVTVTVSDNTAAAGMIRGTALIETTEENEEDYTYTAINGSYIRITGYTGSAADLTIPAEIGDYTVQTIGDGAFKGNTAIHSVIIPETVTTIEPNAFNGCTALETVSARNGLTTIRESAFEGCTSLKQLNFPMTLTTIYAYAFNGCKALTEVQLPDSVTTMGYRAFLDCTGLTKINYPVSFVSCPGRLGSYYSSEYGQIFYGCTALTKVTIPEGVTQIAPASFQNSAVSDVTLPSTLTGFGAEAFKGCKSLEGIGIPESVTAIESSVFADCTALSDINLPEGMESIGESAFAGCTSLASIRLPESVTTIYAYAFNGCTSLSDIQLNEGLTTIYAYAFQNCTAAESLTVPDSVTQIGYRAFLNMTGLTQANLPKGLTECPGRLGSYYSSEYGQLFYGCSSLKTVTIPEGIGAIPAGVFESCTGITSLVIPEGITDIGDNAFRNMTGLEQLSLPKSLTGISTEMLAGCTAVRSLVIPENVETIYTNAFKGMTGLTEVELPDGLTTIYAYAFQDCTGLKSLELPDSVTTIGYRAFLNMTSLRSINYPVSLESCPGRLGSYYASEYGQLFYGCGSLKNLVIPEGVSQIPAGAFRGCAGLYKVLLPESLVTINAEAFSGCTGLEILSVGAGVTSIGANAFANCDKLTIYGTEGSYAQTYAAENNIPFTTEAVESESGVITGTVTDEAGEGIEGAEISIYRVDKQRVDGIVTTGADGTFTFDKAVDTKTYRIWVTHPQYSFADSPVTVTVSDNTAAAGTIRGTVLIETTEENEEDYTYTEINGSYIKITGYTGSAANLTIPSEIGEYTVQAIGNGAFKGNNSIRSVILPETVTTIEPNAFNGCTALETVSARNGLTTIRESAFAGCTSLKQLNFPMTLTMIYAYAFEDCTSLTEVQLPDSVTTMGYRAFLDCTGLTKINYPVSFVSCPGRLGSYYSSEYGQIFYGCTALTKVTIPEGVTQIAPASFQNSAVSDVTLPSTLTGFGAETFKGCKSLEGIEIPESVTFIGSSVFADCTALAAIDLPAGMESIGDSAFAGCTSLTSIRLPESMTTIYAYAFNGCTALSDIQLNDGLTTIYAYAFQNCTAAESLVIPDSVTQIGYRAFLNMTGLTQANLPKGLTGCPGKLGSYYASEYGQLFYGCSNLKTVTIPEGIAAIPAGVFESCTGITSLVIPEGITAIGDNAFRNMIMLEQISLPKSLTCISTEMLAGCTSMRSLVIPENVETIYTNAFNGMKGLTEVELPEGLTTIYAYAFQDCNKLKSLELPDSVTQIGYRAFLNMTSLRSINYPVSLESCPGKLGSYYASEYGELFYGCSSLKNLVIPEGVSQIPAGAFRNCTTLRNITLPKSLRTIGDNAFYGCKGMPYVDLPYGIETIGANAFYGCEGIRILEIPSSVRTIGAQAFYGAINLETLTIYEGTESIGEKAFANCTQLQDVTLPASVKTLGSNIFQNDSKVLIHCVANSPAGAYAVDNDLEVDFTEETGQTTYEIIDPSASFYSFEVANALSKGYISAAVTYTIRDDVYDELSDLSVKIKFPTSVRLDFKSITLDGREVGGTVEGQSLIVPVTEKTGTIKFTLTPQTNKNYYTFAQLNYVRDKKASYEVIDTVSAEIPDLSVVTDELTTDGNVKVYGVGPAGQTLNIMVDGTAVKTVKALKSGSYATTISIPDPQAGAVYIVSVGTEDTSGNEFTVQSSVSYIPEQPVVTTFDMYYNNHQEAKMDLLNEGAAGSAVAFNPAYPFTFVVGIDNAETVEDVRIKSVKKGDVQYIDAVFDEISGNFVASGYFGGIKGYVPGSLSVEFKAQNTNIYNIESESTQELLYSNVKKMYSDAGQAVTISEETTDPNTGAYEALVKVKNGYEKYFGGSKEFNLFAQVEKATVDNEHWKQMVDGYKIFDHYFDAESDGYFITVIDNYVHNPTDDNAKSGFLMLIGDSFDNTITKLAVIDDQGLAAGDYFKGMSFFGKGAKGMAKILGCFAFSDEMRGKIRDSTLDPDLKKRLYEDVDDYEKTCAIYQGVSALVGMGLVFAPKTPAWAVVKVTYYVVDYFAQDYLTQWKEAIKNGNPDYDFLDYLDYKINWFLERGGDVLLYFTSMFGFPGIWFLWIIDPAGTVYEGSPDNPIAGATVTLYYQTDSGGWEVWDASEYSQTNPLITGSDGTYAWDVPEGQWKVYVSCDGYEGQWSDEFPVPPEQTDINLNMQATGDVELTAVYAHDDYVELIFSQLVRADSLGGITLTDKNGKAVDYTINYTDSYMDEDGNLLVNSCRLVYGASSVTGAISVFVPDTVKSYNGSSPKEETVKVTKTALPKITVGDTAALRSGDTIKIRGSIENYTGQETITAETENYSIAKVKSINQPNADGQFSILLDGVNKGTSVLTIQLAQTDIAGTVEITVGSTVDENMLVTGDGHDHVEKTEIVPATTKAQGSKTTTCTICGETISEEIIPQIKSLTLSKSSLVYNGKVQKPKVTVKDVNGDVIDSSGYTVKWPSGCKLPGKYTVKVTFKGSYAGTLSKSYNIIIKGTTISKVTAASKGFTVKWKKQTTQTTGYQIQYSTSSKFKSGSATKTVTITKKTTVSKKITKLKAKKKYYVRVRTYKTIGKKKYYSAWSKAKAVTTKK